MYIATNDYISSRYGIMEALPVSLRKIFCGINLDEAEEIRLIKGKPIYIRYSDGFYYITAKGVLNKSDRNGITVTGEMIEDTMERITKSSLYAVKDEIRKGYISISGGHRIGIVGTAVTENDRVEFIKDISALNFRLACEVVGCADGIVDKIVTDNGVNNTLIVSPPGCGKTTLLRDLVRQLSESGRCVGVADERCEIGAMNKGTSFFDLGINTVVLENCSKQYAINMLLRSMSPDVIATDELGSDGDYDAVYNAINSGVSVVATAHGSNMDQLCCRRIFKSLLPLFQRVIFLSRRNGAGTVEEIVCNDGND